MRNPLIAIILFIIITFSCTTEQHDKSDKTNDTIEVCYLKGWRMSSIPVSCKEFAESVQQLDVDTTIFINKELFGELNKCFITKKQIDTLYCDTKILIKKDSLHLCLYDCDCDSNQTAIDLQTIYKLKTISGYYNFWTKEMLSYQKEIEMFGIPNNYKYYNEDKHLDTITLIKDLGKPVKVLLVKEN
ncbi:MAG: hypothetical protein J6A02_04550 [Prevotella sp.]|nr:hypothetical protein [Prevotella sp.]